MFFPALANFAIHRAGMWPRNLVAGKVLETGLCALSLSVALPMSVALFQQKSTALCESLEEEFREVRDEQGQLIKVMYFNKGL